MADVTRVEQGTILTSIGEYNIPFIYIDAPLETSVPQIRYRLADFLGIKQDFFYKNGTGVACSVGDELSVSSSGTTVTVQCGQTQASTTTINDYGFSAIIIGTDDYAIVWGLALADGPVKMSVAMGIDATETPVTSSTFGTYTWTSIYTGTFSTTIGGNINTLHYWANYLLNHQPPTYNWQAWDQLNGNGGQYRANLTMIKVSAFDNIDPTSRYQRGDSYYDIISTQSSIWNIFQNAALNTEYIIAYSGENYLTITVTDWSATPGVKKFIFKFYAPGSSTTTPLVTTEKIIYVGGTTPDIDCYLSFIYDNEAQVAVFLPIVKSQLQAGLVQYTFGDENPSDDDMLYTFMWLQMSAAGTPEYPYDTGSTDNGGDPSGPKPGDHITPADVPTLGAMGTGMFTVYCPTDTQLGQIATFLWSDNLITNLKKYFNSVSENIISLYVLPYKPGTLPTKNFQVGNMQSDTITNVEYITSRFVSIDMGSVYVENEYDSYLDYSPYTKFECYLPGIGVVTLDADDIMTPTDPDTGTLKNSDGATLSLKYTIDLMTGILVAFIFIDDEMRYQFSGKIGYEIPLTGETYSNMVRGFITAAAGLIGTVATGGMSAPLTAASVGAAVSGTVNAMKPEIHRGGNLSGDASMMGKKTPYLIYHKPNKPLLENQAIYTGFPSYKSGLLSEFEGFTQVIDAHVEGISCTETERAELLQLLKSGVII